MTQFPPVVLHSKHCWQKYPLWIIVTAMTAAFLLLDYTYGAAQGSVAAFGVGLLLSGILTQRKTHTILGMIVAGVAFWSTQTGYQYARRNSDEIIAAACELMDQRPKAEDIWASDPRVSDVLRKLGACRVTVGEDYVYVYVGGHCGEGFFIYRSPHPQPPIGSDTWKITDRLWYYEGS